MFCNISSKCSFFKLGSPYKYLNCFFKANTNISIIFVALIFASASLSQGQSAWHLRGKHSPSQHPFVTNDHRVRRNHLPGVAVSSGSSRWTRRRPAGWQASSGSWSARPCCWSWSGRCSPAKTLPGRSTGRTPRTGRVWNASCSTGTTSVWRATTAVASPCSWSSSRATSWRCTSRSSGRCPVRQTGKSSRNSHCSLRSVGLRSVVVLIERKRESNFKY